MRVSSILLILCFGLLPVSLQAQDILTEAAFWAQLTETQTRLDENPPPLELLRERWENVDEVQLADGSTLSVNMSWLQQGLQDGSEISLAQTAAWIDRLLEYHESFVAGSTGSSNISIAALDALRRDPRFIYADEPLDVAPQPRINLPNISPDVAQIVMVVLAVVAVAAVLVYLMRNLRQQSVSLPFEQQSDDPTTTGDALQRAETEATNRDYRSAIRYLYLACLLLLDERQIIRYDSSLTNREHVRQLREKPHLQEGLRQIVKVFEDVWYGYAPVDEHLYQRFTQQIEQLKLMVK
jgi:hypothetical protein